MSENPRDAIKFGTDGWRGVISDNFTFKNVRIVAQAISDWVKQDASKISGQKKMLAVGYDTRFMSGDYAKLVSQVFAANGIDVLLSDTPIPTPALSYGVPDNKCVAGIMITASHNPYQFNGIKIKTPQGGGASKDITDRVEAYLGQAEVKSLDLKEAIAQKKVVIHDFKVRYLQFIKGYIDLKKIKNARFKVLTDAMHGSGNGLMGEILKETKIRLELMRSDVNPYFEGKKPEPVVEYLKEILYRVKKEKFDLGLVLDGDADRIASVQPGGEFLHPQKILGLLILHLVRNRGRKGGVVKTLCGTTMIDKIAQKLGLKLYETPVGFKYISDLMVAEEIVAGGEEAGGMGVQGFVPERDGTLAGLLLLEMMVYQKKNIKKIVDEMEKEFGRYYYERADVQLQPGKKVDMVAVAKTKKLLGKKVVDVKDFDGVKLICEDESWLMLRPSGTEPLVRAYSEAKSLDRAKKLIKYGESLLKK
ncbi:MAG: phosphoglucomutase/phosphomannomutase family protein [Candidatus Omnitrophica bacterium]|nr:phosphoglucomutase/phosphomannomutase family protein [Candidatus Omnitrophota bacterium]